MKTRSSMLSSLAIAALATVTLNSTQALAKGGMGGMHSFSAMRTTPVVVTKYKSLNTTSTYKKLTARNTTALTRKLTTNKVLTGIGTEPTPIKTFPVTVANPIKTFPVTGIGTNPGGAIFNPPTGPIKTFPVTGIGTNPGGAIFNPPTDPIKTLPGGGIIVDPGPGKLPPLEPPPTKPPVVVNPPVVVTPPVSVGVAAAPVAVEAPGCVYEKSVRKLPDGGLQRVIVKVCPDVVVQ
jgi:hypothetical protein